MGKDPPANAGAAGSTSLIPGSWRPLKEEMATHSSILAWKTSWTEEHMHITSNSYAKALMGVPGSSDGKESAQYRKSRLDSWVEKIPWRRSWQPTPVFLPGESRGQRNLVGYSPWGRTELDKTDWLSSNPSMWCIWRWALRRCSGSDDIVRAGSTWWD